MQHLATAYFGSIAYFRQLARAQQTIIEVCDTFPKQTYRNRCTILSAQGPLRLTVPVEKPAGSKSITRDIRIGELQNGNWRTQHWRAIQSAYASAPYFEHYASDIESLLFFDTGSLVAFNLQLTTVVARLFDLELQLSVSQTFERTLLSSDFRAIDYEAAIPTGFVAEPYTQVLFDQPAFYPNPSILDLLFCEGPMGRKKLTQLK